MLYDDVDMNIIDTKDEFGIDKPVDLFKNTTCDNEIVKFQKNISKLFVKKENNSGNDMKLFSKLPKKSKIENEFFNSQSNDSNDKKIEQKSSVMDTSVLLEFKYKSAPTFQEKLAILEERDKYLREIVFKNDSKNMNVIVTGICPDMCPEKERLLREINCSFSTFEGQIVDNVMHVVPELLVKEYSRSSADQDEPLPHELRPEPVLMNTMSYILTKIIPNIETNSVDVSEWYNFCWDRLRSIRKDIIQQQLSSTNIVILLEHMARFHICCADRLFGLDRKVFDEKINAENLVNCLQMLINMYEDLEMKGIYCDNEPEFRIYMMLLLLDSGDIPDVLRWTEEKSKPLIFEAINIFFAFKHTLYTRFFRLVKKTSYLNACILQRYFSTVRTQILNVLVNCYSSGSQVSKFPLDFIKKILEFDTDSETIAFVEKHGLTVTETNEIRAVKSSFTVPDEKISVKSSYILRKKRIPILEAITLNQEVIPKYVEFKVHSSFNNFDVLEENALDASDQKEKVIKLFGNIYEEEDNVMSEDKFEDSSRFDQTQQIITENNSNFMYQAEQNQKVKIPVTDIFIPLQKNVDEPDFVREITEFKTSETELNNKKIENIISPLKLQSSTVFNFSHNFHFDKNCRSEQCELMKPVTECLETGNNTYNELMALDPHKPTNNDTKTVDDIISNNKSNVPLLYSPNQLTTNNMRKSEEVAESLTQALKKFYNLYSNYFSPDNEENEVKRLSIKKENMKLKKVVKRKLKKKNAKKYARLWKQKVAKLKKNRENFMGIVHLGPEEYFNLWGIVHKNQNSIPNNIVKEIKEKQDALLWSSRFLDCKLLSINYLGDRFAHSVSVNAQLQYAKHVKLKKKLSIICWKTLFSLPSANNVSFDSFVSKITEFYRVLYYKDKANLNSVQVHSVNGMKVYSLIDLKKGTVESNKVLLGVTSVILYVHEEWETLDECINRVSSVCCTIYPVFIYIILSDKNVYKKDITIQMSVLHKKKLISGWSFIKWENFHTLSKVMFASTKFITRVPYFQVKDVTSFMEYVGDDFFVNLLCRWKNSFKNTPVEYIQLYNKLLYNLRETLCEETLEKYNLSPEFTLSITGTEESQNNLVDPETVSNLISKYTLISFTKWPPKSNKKLIELLKKYCSKLDDAGSTLLSNVMRIVNPGDMDVEVVCARTSWLKVVELWFKYNLYYVSKCHNLNNVFVFYDENKIKDIIEAIQV